ncbi:MAG: prolipoprotein diacylglyceryl transferase [Oscillospiraceae bacterium]|nr:prolipoprotein diacylglyceryl transferase [Oscillospiraceae bacterium]
MIETLSIFGAEISLYFLFWFIGAVAVLLGGYLLGKDLGLSFSKSILYVAGTVVLGYILLWATSWVFGGGKMNGLNFIRIVTFLPVPIFLLTLVLKDSFWKVSDFLAPLVAVFHGLTHIGCIFPGCCHGYPAQWGLYSNSAGTVCFPTQPIEAVSSLLVAAVLLVMQKKEIQQGKLYAWYLVLFGGTRFLWEFLRDNEKIWGNISELAFHALAAMVVGLAALAAMKWIYKRSPRYEK